MATDAQVIANRANALLSTGPKTPEGIENCKHNATRHGLSGAQVVIKGEDPEAYDRERANFFEAYKPQGAIEQMLVESIAQTWWRLQRADRIESHIIKELGGEVAIFTDDKAIKKYGNFLRHRGNIDRSWRHATRELDRLQSIRAKQRAAAIQAEIARSFAASRLAADSRPQEPSIGSVLSNSLNTPPTASDPRPSASIRG